MNRPVYLYGLVSCLAGCGLGDRSFEVEVPEGISHVAVLELNDRGEIVRGSQLREVDRETPFGIAFAPDLTIGLVGYSKEQLAPYDLEARRDLVARAPLRRPEGCEPQLPSPSWFEVRAQSETSTLTFAAPKMTSDFLGGLCPDLSRADVDLDRRCARTSCEVRQQIVGRCQIELELSTCGLEPAKITVDPLGQSCVEWGDNLPLCQAVPGSLPAVEALQCEEDAACTNELYVTIDPEVAPFEVEKIRLFDAPAFLHTVLRQSVPPVPRARIRYSGYAFDLIVLGRRVLVVTTNDTRPEQECKNRRPRILHAFDTESFEMVETTTVPACFTQMVPAPEGGGFFGTFEADGFWQVGRFDARGGLLQSTKVDDRNMAGLGEPALIDFEVFEPAEITLVDGDTKLAALFSRRVEFDMIDPRSIVTLHDVPTTAKIARHDLPGTEDPRAMTAQGRTLVLASQFTHRLIWMDALSGTEEDSIPLGQDSLTLSGFATLSTARSGSLLLASLTGTEGALYALPSRRLAERMTPYDRPLDAFAQIEWPTDRRQLMVGGITLGPDDVWKALVGFVEPEARRYRPDTWVLGDGVLNKFVADEDGHIFALLPWEPSLVRITPTMSR